MPTTDPDATPSAPATGDTPATGSAPARRSRGRGGPPLPAPLAAYAVLTVAAGATYPAVRPDDDAASVLAAIQAAPTAAAVSATLLLASAAPLAVFVAAAVHRLRVLGVRVAGPLIGLVGGVLAAVALLLSAAVGWSAAAVAPLGDAPLVRALTTVSFAAGGPMLALGSALLLAGLSVPALILRLVPRPLAVAGIAVAVAGVVAVLGMIVPVLLPLMPVARFGGLLVLAGFAVTLPVTRRPRNAS